MGTTRIALRPHFGTHVSGGGFWSGGTGDPTDDIVRRLNEGMSVSVFGLRRIGKSSLIKEAGRWLTEKHHRKVLWIDLQKVSTISGVLLKIIAMYKEVAGTDENSLAARLDRLINDPNRIPPQMKAMLNALLSRKVDPDALDDIGTYVDSLFDDAGGFLAGLPAGDKPIVLFDELPFMVLNVIEKTQPETEQRRAAVAGLNRFLATLRNWRSEDVGIAMAFSGSYSMAWLRREHGIKTDHLNDCPAIRLEEQSRDDALAMVAAMVAHTPLRAWTADSATALIDLLPSHYPGVIQLVFQELRGKSCTPDDIREVHRDAILRAVENTYLNQFDGRFRRYDKAEREAARKLFKAIVESPTKVISFDDAVGALAMGADGWSAEELLETLDEDGFVAASRAMGVRFASRLAEAWHTGLDAFR